MNNLFERIDRLKAIDREFQVVGDALERLRIGVTGSIMELPAGTSARDLSAAGRNLEATYIIRLWAEFETAVRSYYVWLPNEPKLRIRAKDLIDAVAALRRRRAILHGLRAGVHEVREYRNSLVHDRDVPATDVSLPEARRRLNFYLGGYLPERWG